MGYRHKPPDDHRWPAWLNTRSMRRHLEHRLVGTTLRKSDGERLIMNAQARNLGLMTGEGFLTPAGFRFLGRPGGWVPPLPDRSIGRSKRPAEGTDCDPWEPDRLEARTFREILGRA